ADSVPALPPAALPRLAAELRLAQGTARWAAGEARGDRARVGVPASFLCRRASPGARPASRDRPRERARHELGRARREHRVDARRRSADMVKREIVGAHYGLRDWLAQRLTAAVMGVYTLLLIAVLAATPVLDY